MENNNINVEQNSVQENNMNQTQQKPKKKNLAVRIGLGMVAIGLSYLAGYYLGDKIRDHKDNETNTTSAISNKTSNVESNVTSNVESNATSNVTSDVNTNTTNTMSNEHAIALAKTLYEQAEYATFDFLVMDSCKQVKDNTYDCTNQFNNLKKLFSTNGKIGDETTKEFIFNSYKVVKEDDIVKYLREFLYVDDLANVMVECAENEKTYNQIFCIGGPEAIENRIYYEEIAKCLNVPLVLEEVPLQGYLENHPEYSGHLCHRIYDLCKLKFVSILL